ncbi:MAG: type II toxin-antitoxin system RelB/DinJ family antitoxin [Verrucomicrobiota bacterium]|jgi:DNA-damage-inducible protein J|nr:type II toxin-antitoxin system RelB/DinJ family antitoxin [Verrucomicrobiota bacterium]
MAKTSTIHMRIEPEIKEVSDTILNRLGMSTTEAVTLFLNQVILANDWPFPKPDAATPNATTRKAIQAAKSGAGLVRCETAEQLFDQLGL